MRSSRYAHTGISTSKPILTGSKPFSIRSAWPEKRTAIQSSIYGVHFQDKQAYTTADELPEILQAYEVKFRKLITVLRDADPVDRLPNMMPGGFGE
jgi:hypothetical protein